MRGLPKFELNSPITNFPRILMEKLSSHIKFRQSWNNLVDLPARTVSLLYNAHISPQEVVVEIQAQSSHPIYVGWSGLASEFKDDIGIDPILARCLKLKDTQSVVINLKVGNSKLSSIFLEPEHSTDWELIELHAAYIENNLIEQSRCVAVGQIMVIYPTKTSHVKLIVKDIGLSNQNVALIDPFAEISISPKRRVQKSSGKSRSIKSTTSALPADEASFSPAIRRGVSKTQVNSANSDLRGYRLFLHESDPLRELCSNSFVVVSVVKGPGKSTSREPSGSELPKIATQHKYDSGEDSLKEATKVVAKLSFDSKVRLNTAYLSGDLSNALRVSGLCGFKIVIASTAKSLLRRPNTIVFHPFISESGGEGGISVSAMRDAKTKLAESIRSHLVDQGIFSDSPFTNLMRLFAIPEIAPLGGILKFKKSDDAPYWSKSLLLESRVKFEIGEAASGGPQAEPEIPQRTTQSLYGVHNMETRLLDNLMTSPNCGMLLYGASGSGKTAFAVHIAEKLQNDFDFYTKVVCCENFMNSSVENTVSLFSKWINTAAWHEPSLLVLDNLDKIIPAELEQLDNSTSRQLAESLKSIIDKVQRQAFSNLCILVTSTSKESLNSTLLQSHILDFNMHLTAPDKSSRAGFLTDYLLLELSCKICFDVMDVVLETEGYLPNDLRILCDRMYFEASQNISVSLCAVAISKNDSVKALEDFVPSSLRGVKLQKSSAKWADIGGLLKAKSVLLETLEWPTKYAPIFESCPLRLRSGIMLYGYPGCGKTLLASAIAAQCGLNFISIKGPEILNKYIGASEQSVRELFERAQSAKPCILFFDEFDSIAPKRGHDSTGVTDRVVNQMLTQMDGAEGLDGVYVLAATSRPDLIDSALLRPGRLDKSVICGMPSFYERFDILKCLCAEMNLCSDVDLRKVAESSAGFSGADLQGLTYNAYLKAVHDTLKDSELLVTTELLRTPQSKEFFDLDKKQSRRHAQILGQKMDLLFKADVNDINTHISAGSPVQVGQRHFAASLTETKPSISASERLKLDAIYDKFVVGRDGNMPDGLASTEIGGRTTLM